MLYRIKDWDRSYENAETRKLKYLHWTPTPTKLSSRSYSHVVAHPRACEILAAFGAMVKIAANAPRRGYLEDHDGPLDADDMAAITRLPAVAFDIALEVCSTSKVGWVEVVEGAKSEESSATLPGKGARSADSPDISGKPGDSPDAPPTPPKKSEKPGDSQAYIELPNQEVLQTSPRARAKAAGIDLPSEPSEQVRVLLGAVLVAAHSFVWGVGAQGPAAQATVARMVDEADGDVDRVALELHGLYKLGPPGKSFKAAVYVSELLHWREKRQDVDPKAKKPETFNREKFDALAR
jgi:hypothetical protein